MTRFVIQYDIELDTITICISTNNKDCILQEIKNKIAEMHEHNKKAKVLYDEFYTIDDVNKRIKFLEEKMNGQFYQMNLNIFGSRLPVNDYHSNDINEVLPNLEIHTLNEWFYKNWNMNKYI